ncbi:alpha,alpha-trehalose-phosphate synthase [Laccaria bicolor S238N-H82]|uniref:Alpha,alpha-trehalose-phosphate synthase n=1 Tax=Laccaria bicolor (strain S238N-H82 / ATCC MYA-4686) TaxID=486041 RepID=B0D6Z9_LACBS|nr:alpha,alpha-trehalose-phosphate synthase [Laccaria bicolor S238N-H82]EDR09311.1 alpha,alpha-trehalose-phosphate synthase [Laccaria bicolor S238N-H82]|eukprot:XP_001879660.1 alpha,alpha-trehalose-phosphate synthase [Laccaria bicolor S238N-H82]
MSSFRNHRVIIASLFLPTTAVQGESGPPTPDPPLVTTTGNDSQINLPAVTLRLAASPLKPAIVNRTNTHSRQSSASGPLKSIVDDLTDKSRHPTPAIRSPNTEISNPFTKLTRFAPEAVLATSPTSTTSPTLPPISRKHQTTHSDHTPSPRIQRKKSRSTSRKPSSIRSSTNDLPRTSEAWHLEPNTHGNGGLKNAVDSLGDRLRKKVWVGTLGTATDGFSDSLRKNIDQRMWTQRSSLPVWIPDREFQNCYDEFCHQVLWPCLHYAVPDAPKTKLFYESASYKQYVSVNQRFADAIIENYQEGDIIWVNDYHLMLLPSLLRSSPKLPRTAPIGFFMHVAFPSSEIFRCLSVRQDLLLGLLGADLVGFQTANYARHFRQTVSRILAYEALPKGIQVPEVHSAQADLGSDVVRDGLGERGRFVDVGVFPMGIDVKQLQVRKKEADVAEWVQVLKQRYEGLKIVVGRDKLDEVQGVRHKILAFEAFLDKYPEWKGKVVLIQVALQTTESNELAGGVADVVSRINSRFSTLTYQPVVFLHTQDLTFSQYLALLTVGDAFIVTSLREGMALRTHEYVECQEGKYRPLILSEFTGSYSYSGFRSCIAINPWDTRGTAGAIHQALTMSDEEALSRWEDLHNHVTTQTAQAFVTTFLNRCVRAHTEHAQDDISSVPILDVSRLLPRYKHSLQTRLILVDFEGTLWRRDLSREGMMKLAKGEYELPEGAVDVLRKLTEDRKNEVWVLSGLPVRGVLEKVAELVPKVGIVAENGCFIKTRPSRGPGGSASGEWVNMVTNFNLTWKTACLEMLNYFTERTPGSFIEERQASVVWRFWTGETVECQDRQWARRQAAEAQNHIFDSLGERYGLRIIPGKNSFLVLPNNVSRSTAVGAILHPGGPARSPMSRRASWMGPDTVEESSVGGDRDFLLALSSDEKLLRRLNEFDGAETVSTSGKGTDAKWKLDSGETRGVLSLLAGAV